MSTVKPEPGSGSELLVISSGNTPAKNHKLEPENNSRPALKEKTTNVQAMLKKSGIVEERKRQQISQFFQSAEVRGGNQSQKALSQESKLVVKRESSTIPPAAHIGPAAPQKELDGSPRPKKQRIDLIQSSISSADSEILPSTPSKVGGSQRDSGRKQSAYKAHVNPEPYTPVKAALHEASSRLETREYYEEVFQEVQDGSEKNTCIEFAKMDLNAWVSTGQKLQQEHSAILRRLVEARIRLSEKFKVITDLTNERAQALNAQGRVLDQKLRRIQDLGKEILEII